MKRANEGRDWWEGRRRGKRGRGWVEGEGEEVLRGEGKGRVERR